MGLFCNENACWCSVRKILKFRCIFQYFRCIMRNPWEIPGMRPNRLAEEGDGTGWRLISATVTLLIPKQLRSVSESVTLEIGIGNGNFINSKTISDRYRYRYRQL